MYRGNPCARENRCRTEVKRVRHPHRVLLGDDDVIRVPPVNIQPELSRIAITQILVSAQALLAQPAEQFVVDRDVVTLLDVLYVLTDGLHDPSHLVTERHGISVRPVHTTGDVQVRSAYSSRTHTDKHSPTAGARRVQLSDTQRQIFEDLCGAHAVSLFRLPRSSVRATEGS